eukprot:2829331-Amphidinium_carterae.1
MPVAEEYAVLLQSGELPSAQNVSELRNPPVLTGSPNPASTCQSPQPLVTVVAVTHLVCNTTDLLSLGGELVRSCHLVELSGPGREVVWSLHLDVVHVRMETGKVNRLPPH